MVIIGGMHSNEWNALASVLYLMRSLVEPTSPVSLHDYRFTFIPLANPDG